MNSFGPVIGRKEKKVQPQISATDSPGQFLFAVTFSCHKTVSLESPEAASPGRMPRLTVLASSRGKAFPPGTGDQR